MQMLQNLLCRPLNLQDDLRQVARLVYYTDDYVFPYLYDNDIAVCEKVVPNMIRGNTIYNYKNIRVAVCDDKIVGIVVYQRTPIKVGMDEMCRCFFDAGVAVGSRFAKVYNEYYKLLNDEPEGIYIANVCVDKRYRGMGVAKQMLGTFLSDDETYHLETVKANLGALHLYQGLGFQIDCEYAGFTDVPCYRMSRIAK